MKHIDMLGEIIISTELSKLSAAISTAATSKSEKQSNYNDVEAVEAVHVPGFLTVINCYLTEGRYPNDLLKQWDKYDEEKGSENDRPDDNLFGEPDADGNDDQKFVVLELKNSGQDLESITLTNATQGWAVFQQVAHSLAMAEKVLEFEHRDLHWGNVLIQVCNEKIIKFSQAFETFEVETQGVSATIIDFSLSRLGLAKEDNVVIYNNLKNDPDLFISEGDYQFDIYRYDFKKNHLSRKSITLGLYKEC